MKVIKNQKIQKCTSEIFSEVHFINCDFTNANLNSQEISHCIFEKCNFSLTTFQKSSIHETTFKHSKCIGINFSKLTGTFLSLTFDNCLIDTCDFSNQDLRQCIFIKTDIRQCTFFGTNLSKLFFNSCNFHNSQFENTNFNKTDLSTSTNCIINPKVNNIKNIKISTPDALMMLRYLDVKVVD